ncbi:MAG: DUF2993 domain-containing protein [Streptosporangiales bacterium]|nr:DUF2993 domain-containing protein [Streptosporangiales bacterium]
MRKLIITLLVLAALLVVVDRVTQAAAQREVAQQVAQTYDLPDEPDVRIRGFPFLTQALGGRYREIDMITQKITVEDFRLERLDVQLNDVDAPLQALLQRDISEVSAQTVSGHVLVGFSEVRRHLPGGMQVRARGDDLELRGRATVFGRSVPVTAVVDVAARGRTVTFRPTQIEVNGVPGGSFLRDRFSLTLSLRELPMGLRPTDVRVTDGGVRIAATAEDVALSRI